MLKMGAWKNDDGTVERSYDTSISTMDWELHGWESAISRSWSLVGKMLRA